MNTYNVENQWDELARAGYRDDLDRVQRKLCEKVLTIHVSDSSDKSIEERINIWFNQHQFLLERWHKLVSDIKATDNPTFVAYSLILRELFDFISAT